MRKAYITLYYKLQNNRFYERERSVYDIYTKKIQDYQKSYADSIGADYICYGNDIVDTFWKNRKYCNDLQPYLKVLLCKFCIIDDAFKQGYDKVAFTDFDVLPIPNAPNIFLKDGDWINDIDDLTKPLNKSQVKVFSHIKSQYGKLGLPATCLPDGGCYIISKQYWQRFDFYKYLDEFLDLVLEKLGEFDGWIAHDETYLAYLIHKGLILTTDFGLMNDVRWEKSSYQDDISKGGLFHFYNKDEFKLYLEND